MSEVSRVSFCPFSVCVLVLRVLVLCVLVCGGSAAIDAQWRG